ncbi:MAG TPA: acyl-CoA dehydrogenase, partial [Gammaproteobacteria bacterium]|nr:acyl-CoA dehydrogenase [Gammaproteobacteria bacterium]
MNALILLLGALLLLVAFVRYPLPNRYWLLLATLALAAFTLAGGFSWPWGLLAWGLWLGPVLLLSVPDWRRRYLSKPLIARIRKMLPPMSQTERDAIESGTVGWEAELFRGNPDWKRLLS